MKDFHVAPINTDEEPPDVQITNVDSNERGIARFRRIARQVANQTNAHKWGETVKGVRDTQIGKCHNRESYKNQQNLQKAITEAQKLVLLFFVWNFIK